MRHPWLLSFVLVIGVVACTSGDDPDHDNDDDVPAAAPVETDDPEPVEEPDDPPEPEPEPCRHDRLGNQELVTLSDGDTARLSLEVADRTHRCAEVAVVAPDDDPWVAAIAAAAAVAVDGPLLLVGSAGIGPVSEELNELDTNQVLAIGMSGTGLPGTVTTLGAANDGPGELARAVASHLELTSLLAVPEDDEVARAAALARLDGRTALLPVPGTSAAVAELAGTLPPTARLHVVATDGDSATAVTDALLAVGLDAVVAPRPLFRRGSRTSWLVDPTHAELTAVTAVAARGRGESLLPIDAQDLRRSLTDARRVRDADPDRIVLMGEVTPEAVWQLPLILTGPELPGGGFRLFDDRRMVALYGSPETAALGALGEQPLEETIPRLREVAEPYGADGQDILPALEIIVTVASAGVGDGDYSRRVPMELIRSWVDRAAEEQLYVILDLQPGRTDFLTQAQEFEELLLEPHVGLALDPEWRLEPDEVHLEQIGSVAATEVQEVADWLAELTRENNLPEKLLILHQFRHSMLPDRDTIQSPLELAVVVHMDGQGSQAAKLETYRSITLGAESDWLWGWKNFYDEDETVATPDQILALDPLPVFVSYQ